jgi:hypothetical protein
MASQRLFETGGECACNCDAHREFLIEAIHVCQSKDCRVSIPSQGIGASA